MQERHPDGNEQWTQDQKWKRRVGDRSLESTLDQMGTEGVFSGLQLQGHDEGSLTPSPAQYEGSLTPLPAQDQGSLILWLAQGEGSLTPMPGPQAETNPVLRTLWRRLSSLLPLQSCILEVCPMTKHVSLQQRGLLLFQFGPHRAEKDARASGVPVPEKLLVTITGKHFWRSCRYRFSPISFPPPPATPNPHFGVAICFYKMWSFSKDIQFSLLLFSCHSQLKSINAPE